jgi:DNA-binding response OmpR family regulator
MLGEGALPAKQAATQELPVSEIYDDGLLRIEYAGYYVECAGQPQYELARKEFLLLACLARNAGRVVTHAVLWAAAWGPDQHLNTHTLRVHIATLRRKVAPIEITSVVSVGYRLNPPRKEQAGQASLA